MTTDQTKICSYCGAGDRASSWASCTCDAPARETGPIAPLTDHQTMKNRPATREEIIARFSGHRVSFKTYVREVFDARAKNGVRHITRASANCRTLDGIPIVRRHGEDTELFADHFTLDSGRTFLALATVVHPDHRT